MVADFLKCNEAYGLCLNGKTFPEAIWFPIVALAIHQRAGFGSQRVYHGDNRDQGIYARATAS